MPAQRIAAPPRARPPTHHPPRRPPAAPQVCAAIEEVDGCTFRQDAWTRPSGGGGITRVLQEGNVWEKAGVAVSVVYGSMPAESYRVAVGRDIPFEKVGRAVGPRGRCC